MLEVQGQSIKIKVVSLNNLLFSIDGVNVRFERSDNLETILRKITENLGPQKSALWQRLFFEQAHGVAPIFYLPVAIGLFAMMKFLFKMPALFDGMTRLGNIFWSGVKSAVGAGK